MLTSLLLSLALKTHLYVALFIRGVLIYYGDYHDSTMLVKYTDVDYKVFTDAARHVMAGESPYDRHTYRYTPALAYMLLPNLTVSPLFGKCLFAVFDVLSGALIYSFVKDFTRTEFHPKLCALLWLYNPLVMAVSTRGNAESIICTLVLVTLHLFREKVFVLAGIFFGLSVHFKLYPIIYSLGLFLALSDKTGWRCLVQVNLARFRFMAGLAISLGATTLLFYQQYGDSFLEETYLYHISRKDTRHNFSPYFYMLYLTCEDDDIGISLLTFLPQILLLIAIAKKFGNARDLPFCIFCQTVVFVAYNKVITSQYFLWYLCVLPLSFPQLRLSKGEGLLCLVIWMATQGSWLLPAYYLEFQGSNTFQAIWMESLAFFTANIYLLSKFIRKYREVQVAVEARCDINKVD